METTDGRQLLASAAEKPCGDALLLQYADAKAVASPGPTPVASAPESGIQSRLTAPGS